MTMLSLSEATAIAERHTLETGGAPRGAAQDLGDGWFFPISFIGSVGFVVDKEDGHVLDFGSAYPLETWLWAWKSGFRWDTYDLIVTSVTDMRIASEALRECLLWLGASHKPRRGYSADALRNKLASLPVRFSNQDFWLWMPQFRAAEGALLFRVEPDTHQTVPASAQQITLGPAVLIDLAHDDAFRNVLLDLVDNGKLDVVPLHGAFGEAERAMRVRFDEATGGPIARRERRRAGLPRLSAPGARAPDALYKLPLRDGVLPAAKPYQTFAEVESLRTWLATHFGSSSSTP